MKDSSSCAKGKPLLQALSPLALCRLFFISSFPIVLLLFDAVIKIFYDNNEGFQEFLRGTALS